MAHYVRMLVDTWLHDYYPTEMDLENVAFLASPEGDCLPQHESHTSIQNRNARIMITTAATKAAMPTNETRHITASSTPSSPSATGKASVQDKKNHLLGSQQTLTTSSNDTILSPVITLLPPPSSSTSSSTIKQINNKNNNSNINNNNINITELSHECGEDDGVAIVPDVEDKRRRNLSQRLDRTQPFPLPLSSGRFDSTTTTTATTTTTTTITTVTPATTAAAMNSETQNKAASTVGLSGTRMWRTLLGSCTGNASTSSRNDRGYIDDDIHLRHHDHERTNMAICADSVLYRSTADGEVQVTSTRGSTSSSSSSSSCNRNRITVERVTASPPSLDAIFCCRSMTTGSGEPGTTNVVYRHRQPCRFSASSRRIVVKAIIFICVVFLITALLETLYYLHSPCDNGSGKVSNSWLAYIIHPLGALFGSSVSDAASIDVKQSNQLSNRTHNPHSPSSMHLASITPSASTTPSTSFSLSPFSSLPSLSSSLSTFFSSTSAPNLDSNSKIAKNMEPFVDTTGRRFPWQNIRLPHFIKPISYELFMHPSMITFYNRGNVSIEFELLESTNFLVIHSKKLNVTSVRVSNFIATDRIEVTQTYECLRLEQLYIGLQQNLSLGVRYRLTLEFERKLADELEGFYISSYYNAQLKRKRYLLTTHFEPTLARTAFPCFDEPAMKATFRLRMLHDPQYNVYFNTYIVHREDIYHHHHHDNNNNNNNNDNNEDDDGDDDLSQTEVDHRLRLSISEPTVPMSTYLVAFVVCDFVENTTHSADGIQIRTIVPSDQNGNTPYALNFASQVLTFFQNFFKVAYPLRKLDLVAVPDFGAGAMENWGIITFRTTTLLVNEADSSLEMQEQVATVIAHEIAHQWFGNLVTMDWWTHLWLNEGFASYVENLGVDYIHPEWRMLDQFVISTTQQALAMDSLLSSHPIHTTVTNPAEIEAIFDMISYKKGSSLVRMIEHFLGKENLQLGLEKYLNRYKYRTATTTQLWESMSEVAASLPINVSSVMDTWIMQQGYPVISVRWASNEDEDGDDDDVEDDRNPKYIFITQRRFVCSLPPNEFDSYQTRTNLSLAQRWIVPLTVISGESDDGEANRSTTTELYWLQDQSMRIPLDRRRTRWFKLNAQQSGFYRVNYDVAIWRDMIAQLGDTNHARHFLSPADRSGLLDDALSLMRIGQLDVNTAMDLTRYLENGEHDYVPWETILNHFGTIDSLMLQHPILHRYILRLMRSLVRRLGWTDRADDGMFAKKLRAILLRAAVFYGDPEARDSAVARFRHWMSDGVRVDANIREIVYSAGTQYGGDVEWQHCWRAYINATDGAEKRILLGALGATRNAYLLSSYLTASLDKSVIRSQDTPFVVQNVARNPIGRTMAWTFVKANWPYIISVFGQGSFSIDAIVSESTWHFFTPHRYDEVRQFFDRVQVGSGQQAVRQSLEKIQANIYWKSHVEAKVIRWLSSNNF